MFRVQFTHFSASRWSEKPSEEDNPQIKRGRYPHRAVSVETDSRLTDCARATGETHEPLIGEPPLSVRATSCLRLHNKTPPALSCGREYTWHVQINSNIYLKYILNEPSTTYKQHNINCFVYRHATKQVKSQSNKISLKNEIKIRFKFRIWHEHQTQKVHAEKKIGIKNRRNWWLTKPKEIIWGICLEVLLLAPIPAKQLIKRNNKTTDQPHINNPSALQFGVFMSVIDVYNIDVTISGVVALWGTLDAALAAFLPLVSLQSAEEASRKPEFQPLEDEDLHLDAGCRKVHLYTHNCIRAHACHVRTNFRVFQEVSRDIGRFTGSKQFSQTR